MIHLWHELSPGPQPPEVVYAVVEVPKGSRNKYEYAKRAGVIKLDRVLYSSLHYPGDYGFIPQSYFEDGDPLDILIMVTEPTFPGCVIEARPIGMFKMIDKGEPDYKILAVPATDPHFKDFQSMKDVSAHFPQEVAHFFMTYKQLEGAEVKNEGWTDAAEARATIQGSLDLYRRTFPTQGL
jgi:inorganic pyrophosphatase